MADIILTNRNIEMPITVFKGLSELEENENRTVIPEYQYRSAGEAFDTAVDALKMLISKD